MSSLKLSWAKLIQADFVTLWTVAHQALSMGFSREKHWSGLPFPSPGDLPAQGLNPHVSSPALADGFFTSTTWETHKAKLLSHFSRVRLCDPIAHQAPLSLGSSRQEYWSGLPFPSPVRESEVAHSFPTLSDPMDCSLPGSSVHGIFQARVLEWAAIAFSISRVGGL